MEKLPEKLSDLITLALGDLEATEKDPRYSIDMDTWHLPEGSTCSVCLAGSIIAQRSGWGPDEDVTPTRASKCSGAYPLHDMHNRGRLNALNYVRDGYMAAAFQAMGRASDDGLQFQRAVTKYEHDPKEFKEDLKTLVKELKAKGY